MRSALVLALLAACGGSGGGPPSTGSFQLGATGVSPISVSIASGGHVTFVNKDAAAHQITSSCAALQSASLAPNATFTSAAITGPANCAFSDALNPGNAGFDGTVSVAAPPAPGY